MLLLKGFCMGASDVIPGVSGGTMAFITGIYEELISAISSFDLHFLRLLLSFRIRDALSHVNFTFLAWLGGGILLAIFSLARVLSWLLQNEPVLIWSFFFGLIVASVYTVSRQLANWRPPLVLWAIVGAFFTYFLVGLVPAETPYAPWFLFISGAIAICAMILPGISGAFILVLMGKYLYVLDAVKDRDLFTLLLVAAGAGFGLAGFSRLLKWFFKRYHDSMIAVLTGFMLGSLRKVWPWKLRLQEAADDHGLLAGSVERNVLPSGWDMEVMVALALALAGMGLVLWLSLSAEKKAGPES